MPPFQDPIGKIDLKVTESHDISIKRSAAGNIPNTIGSVDSTEVLRQILAFCIKTKAGEHRKQVSFGAAPRGIKTKMLPNSINDLKSYIVENIRKSGINPKDYPFVVNAFPIGKESLAIEVAFILNGIDGIRKIGGIFMYDESAQALRTVKAFGV